MARHTLSTLLHYLRRL